MNRRSFLRTVLGVGAGLLAAPLGMVVGAEEPATVKAWHEYDGEWYEEDVEPFYGYVPDYPQPKPSLPDGAPWGDRYQRYLEDAREMSALCCEWLKTFNNAWRSL